MKNWAGGLWHANDVQQWSNGSTTRERTACVAKVSYNAADSVRREGLGRVVDVPFFAPPPARDRKRDGPVPR